MSGAAGVPGIRATREISLLVLLLAGVLTPFALALWLVSLPLLVLHTASGIILSGLTQRDWLAVMRYFSSTEEA